ncbi:MAG TPA: CDP-alcohol phosphatidyltransferase family protein [Acidobacteriaceae bacterium]|jgi:phosphatidylglycerophosphate synthase
METTARRPIRTRDKAWVQWLAAALANAGVTPNFISCMSLACSVAASVCLAFAGRYLQNGLRVFLLLAAAAGIQLRLLCNLLDGLVAVEGGKRTPTGELFNEVPDRLADSALLIAAGYAAAAWARDPGWLAALLAVMTAYVRVLGGALGLKQRFSGPMAKQQRMALLTAACLGACFEPLLGTHGVVIGCALAVIVLGSAVTVLRRLAAIARELQA